MSYWLEDANGYVGDLASNGGMVDLLDGGPEPLRLLLASGGTDQPEMVTAAATACRKISTMQYIADMLFRSTAPVIVTDGSEPDSLDDSDRARRAGLTATILERVGIRAGGNPNHDDKGKLTSAGDAGVGKSPAELGWATTHNGTDISNERTLTKYDTPGVLAARAKIRGAETTAQLPDRDSIRQSAADKAYGDGAATKGRTADIVIGGPASGKSSAVAEPLAAHNGAIMIDADIVKPHIPEFDGGHGAGLVHNESSAIAEGPVLGRAIANGDNMVMPMVGRDTAKVAAIASSLRAHGYTVNLHYVDVDTHTQIERSMGRFAQTGRFVDPAYIQSVDHAPEKTFNTLSESPLFHSAYRHDNNDTVVTSTKVRSVPARGRRMGEYVMPSADALYQTAATFIPAMSDAPRMIVDPDVDSMVAATLRAVRPPTRSNPNHVPAGSPEGGQFASAGDDGMSVMALDPETGATVLHTNVPKDPASAEQRIRAEPYEVGYIYDKDGKPIAIGVTQKHPNMVQFSSEQLRRAQGGVLTHNHPGSNQYGASGSFSRQDILLAAHYDMAEIRAVTPGGTTYRMQRPANGWPSEDRINDGYHEAAFKVTADTKDMLASTLAPQWADRVWTEVAPHLNLRYSKILPS